MQPFCRRLAAALQKAHAEGAELPELFHHLGVVPAHPTSDIKQYVTGIMLLMPVRKAAKLKRWQATRLLPATVSAGLFMAGQGKGRGGGTFGPGVDGWDPVPLN